MFYHASNVAGLEWLNPHVSNHGQALVYLSEKRENVLVYLSNAVEKHCRGNGFAWNGPWHKWASYGFHKDGLLLLEEYYPNAIAETYRSVSGYIYQVNGSPFIREQQEIRDVWIADQPVQITSCEFVPDAYEAILAAQRQGKLMIKSYEEISEGTRSWLKNIIPQEYAKAGNHPEYQFFLQSKFGSFLPD